MSVVEVAVGVIFGNDGHSVLVTQRTGEVHLAGKWEFPGGKLEPGETPYQALQREIVEELGIEVDAATPILTLPYRYPEKSVLLHIFRVDRFRGEASAREHQPLRFQAIDSLLAEQFPAANLPIIRWLQLPDYYCISPEPSADHNEFLRNLQNAMQRRRCMLQFRAKTLSDNAYAALARRLLHLCDSLQRPLLLNCSVELFEKIPAAGLHLTAQRARQYSSRPIASDRLLACSCHTAEELRHAAQIDADFVVLSLVKSSSSHPDASVLGWDGFARLCVERPYAIYALGGMQLQDLARAHQIGARGIAGISALV